MNLSKKDKARLAKVNNHLNKFGGRNLTEEEAIRFNIDHNCASGYDAGSTAFYLAEADWHKYSQANNNYYLWIGDGLITISENATGVPYDCSERKIKEIVSKNIKTN